MVSSSCISVYFLSCSLIIIFLSMNIVTVLGNADVNQNGADVNQDGAAHFLSDQYIADLNEQNLSWKAGRNYPSTLTKVDIVRLFGELPAKIPDVPKRRKSFDDSLLQGLPNEFDSRKQFKHCAKIINAVPDQGACPAPYAFAIPSVASDRLCIHSKGRIKKLLSAEYVTACCKSCRWPQTNKPCSTGFTAGTWGFLHRRGLVTGGGYKSKIGCQPVSFPTCNHTPTKTSQPFCSDLKTPQPKCHTRCTNENYQFGFFQDKYKFKKFTWILMNATQIQTEIMINGPVAANMYIFDDFLNYKSGVYKVSNNAKPLSYVTVKIIGWGTENNTPYWLVVSTFGIEFGQNGLFKIIRGKNEAYIEELVSASVPRNIFNKTKNEIKGEDVIEIEEHDDEHYDDDDDEYEEEKIEEYD